jgi:transposase
LHFELESALILDNLRVHHAKLVKAWLAKHEDEIEVFYLPSYSPELNPDEMLNADLKQAVTTKAPARTKGQLLKTTTSHMRKLQKSPERVKSYFEHAPFDPSVPDSFSWHPHV